MRISRLKLPLANLALLIASLVMGLVAVEMGYRLLLSRSHPQHFQTADTARPDLWFFQASPWRFNLAHGYEYVPGLIHGGSSSGGRVTACWTWWTNPAGNMGRIEGSYDQAQRRVLVFGDSFTAQPEGDLTWPNLFQERLTAELGKPVHAVNFGRDGYGVLQMVQLAADKVAAMRPDLVVIAFITDDLTRDRFWRTQTVVGGRERILTTIDPNPHPDLNLSADTAIMHSKATVEWCNAMKQSGRTEDPVLADMEQTMVEARRRAALRMGFFDPTTSLLYGRLVHGAPFHVLAQRGNGSQNPRHKLEDFSADAGFLAALQRLKAAGVPIVLFHMATYDELVAGHEYRLTTQEEKLLESLRRHVSPTIIETKINAPAVPDLGAIRRGPTDSHPSLFGMQFYTDALTTGLRRSHPEWLE